MNSVQFMKPFLLACAVLATACTVDEVAVDNDEDEPLPSDELGEIDAADLPPGCNQATTVILYSESTNAFTLPQAFAATADPCTHYYVYLPALTTDKTLVRASADKVHALGPTWPADTVDALPIGCCDPGVAPLLAADLPAGGAGIGGVSVRHWSGGSSAAACCSAKFIAVALANR